MGKTAAYLRPLGDLGFLHARVHFLSSYPTCSVPPYIPTMRVPRPR